MIGKITVLDGRYYFTANKEGTMITMPKMSLPTRFWVEFRQLFKEWDYVEVINFIVRR